MVDDRVLFVLLADRGTFGAVAQKLGVSRSTVMRRLDALEARMGATLVQRVGRRIALTEAGHRYAAALRPVLRELSRIEDAVRSMAGALAGTVRVDARGGDASGPRLSIRGFSERLPAGQRPHRRRARRPAARARSLRCGVTVGTPSQSAVSREDHFTRAFVDFMAQERPRTP